MFIIGFVIFLISIVIVTMDVGEYSFFIDIKSIIIVLGSLLSVIIVTESFEDIIEGFKGVLLKNYSISKVQLKRSIKIFDLLIKICIASGFIGTIIGILLMMSNLENPSSIGQINSIILLSWFYAIIIGFFIFLPAKSKLEKKEIME